MSPGTTPAWLPPHIPFNGDWNVFVRALYILFTRDFKNNWPRFRERPVWHVEPNLGGAGPGSIEFGEDDIPCIGPEGVVVHLSRF